MEVNNTTSQMDLSDIHRMFHWIATEYSSGIHGISSRIDHTFNHTHKKKTSKYSRKYALYQASFNHNEMKLKINNKNTTKFTNTWKFNNTLLDILLDQERNQNGK